MKINFVNLSRQYIEDKQMILNSINKISTKGDFILGNELQKFENKNSRRRRIYKII